MSLVAQELKTSQWAYRSQRFGPQSTEWAVSVCRPWPCADALGEVFGGIFKPPLLFPSCVGFHWGQGLCCRERRSDFIPEAKVKLCSKIILHNGYLRFFKIKFPFPILLHFFSSIPSDNNYNTENIVSMDKTGWWRPLLVLLHTHEVRPIGELRGRVRRLWKGWGRVRQAFHCKETEQHVEHTLGTHTK